MCHIWIMSVNPMWWRFGTLFRTWNWNVSAFGNVQRKPWTMGHLRSFNTMYIWQLLKTIDSNTQSHNGNFIMLVNECSSMKIAHRRFNWMLTKESRDTVCPGQDQKTKSTQGLIALPWNQWANIGAMSHHNALNSQILLTICLLNLLEMHQWHTHVQQRIMAIWRRTTKIKKIKVGIHHGQKKIFAIGSRYVPCSGQLRPYRITTKRRPNSICTDYNPFFIQWRQCEHQNHFAFLYKPNITPSLRINVIPKIYTQIFF